MNVIINNNGGILPQGRGWDTASILSKTHSFIFITELVSKIADIMKPTY